MVREIITQYVENSVDFHCHGIGRFDFTDIGSLNLQEIESILAHRKQRCVLTLYLPQSNFEAFLGFMEKFNAGRKTGQFKHIAGIGLEGPLLASHGGTPESGVWMPSYDHWEALSHCGKKGLIYIILSPDAFLPGSNFSFTRGFPDMIWIIETLLTGGVLPAPGHFTKMNPIESATKLQTLFDIVASWYPGAITLTDHLFNDMPHNFPHAWRTPQEKERREEEIRNLGLETWSLSTLEEDLGMIPATMIRNAHKGRVKICQNFDGEHVDLAVVKRAVELIGAENMLMMTDSIESRCLAGRTLYMQSGSTLLYQDNGIVAAGSQDIYHQVNNMISMGLSKNQITLLTRKVPQALLDQHLKYAEIGYAQVTSV